MKTTKRLAEAKEAAAFLTNELRGIGSEATQTEFMVIIDLIKVAAEIETKLSALIDAIEYDSK